MEEFGVALPEGFKFDQRADLFQSEKQKMVGIVLDCFTEGQKEALEASLILKDPIEMLRRRVALICSPEEAASSATIDGGADGATAKASVEAKEHDDTTLRDWLDAIKEIERDEAGVDVLTQAAIVVQLQATLLECFSNQDAYISEAAAAGAMMIRKKVITDEEQGGKSTQKYEIVKGTCKLQFYGTVVTGDVASRLPKATTLPLVERGGGMKLFLDGRGFANRSRSDNCWAWHVPPLPQPKKKDEGDDVDKTPDKKKVEKDTAVATHRIIHEPITVKVSGSMKFEYDVPCLCDLPDVAASLAKDGKPLLYRELLPWDTEEFKTDAKAKMCVHCWVFLFFYFHFSIFV